MLPFVRRDFVACLFRLSSSLYLGGIVAVGWYGASLVQSNNMSGGELFSFVIYMAFIGGSIAGLGDMYAQLQRAIGATERVFEILQEKDEQELPATKGIKLSGKIEFKDVSFSYPTRKEFTVLRQLNFRIEPGEKVALVGRKWFG